jgi:hypothetical protein
MVLSSPVWRGKPEAALGIGLVTGALVSATVIVIVGSLLRLVISGLAWPIVLTACAVLVLRELRVVSFGLPQNARLVPQSVFRHGPHFGSFEFGFEMGTGVRTYVTSSLPYALVLAIGFGSDLPTALIAGVGFGLGRLIMTTTGVRYGDLEQRWPSWSDTWDRYAIPLQSVLCLCFASLLVVVFLLRG